MKMETLTPQDIATYGINTDNLNEPLGDANIIVQCFGKHSDDPDRYSIHPVVYMPRKETCFNANINLLDEDAKQEYLSHLRDSQERLKIMSALLHKQEEEIIKYGYPKTTCYYPKI